MNDEKRAERLAKVSPLLDQLLVKQPPTDLSELIEDLACEICDSDPVSEKVADRLAAFVRRLPKFKAQIRSALLPRMETVKGSAGILIDGLLFYCGDSEAEVRIRERLKRGNPERLDSLSLERLLTAVSWQQDEALLKPVKALKKRLESGRIARDAVGVAQGIHDFLNAHKKATKSQIQQIKDLVNAFEDGAARLEEFYLETGVSDLQTLRKGEADRLTLWLQVNVAKSFPDRITTKQIGYIRSLIRKLKLDDGSEEIIAQEVAQVNHLAKLNKEQASAVIEFLLGHRKA